MDLDTSFLVIVSGESPSLALAEIRGICEAEDCNIEILSIVDNRKIMLRAESKFRDCIRRAGLTNEVYEEIFELPAKGKFKIESSDRVMIHKYAEFLISRGFKVDLIKPDYVFRAEKINGVEFFGLKVFERNKSEFESRKVRYRPYCKPISVHPKLARVMVNLARTRKGEKFLDPFCGTGGILIEASLIGAVVYGLDIDVEMVKGSYTNLSFYGLRANIEWGDVAEAIRFGKFRAIATDPPYGRSASSNKEKITDLYERAFRTFAEILDGYLCINLPDDRSVELGQNYLKLKEVYHQRVHKNLTRRICVYSS